jgi:hypothetical protein
MFQAISGKNSLMVKFAAQEFMRALFLPAGQRPGKLAPGSQTSHNQPSFVEESR